MMARPMGADSCANTAATVHPLYLIAPAEKAGPIIRSVTFCVACDFCVLLLNSSGRCRASMYAVLALFTLVLIIHLCGTRLHRILFMHPDGGNRAPSTAARMQLGGSGSSMQCSERQPTTTPRFSIAVRGSQRGRPSNRHTFNTLTRSTPTKKCHALLTKAVCPTQSPPRRRSATCVGGSRPSSTKKHAQAASGRHRRNACFAAGVSKSRRGALEARPLPPSASELHAASSVGELAERSEDGEHDARSNGKHNDDWQHHDEEERAAEEAGICALGLLGLFQVRLQQLHVAGVCLEACVRRKRCVQVAGTSARWKERVGTVRLCCWGRRAGIAHSFELGAAR